MRHLHDEFNEFLNLHLPSHVIHALWDKTHIGLSYCPGKTRHLIVWTNGLLKQGTLYSVLRSNPQFLDLDRPESYLPTWKAFSQASTLKASKGLFTWDGVIKVDPAQHLDLLKYENHFKFAHISEILNLHSSGTYVPRSKNQSWHLPLPPRCLWDNSVLEYLFNRKKHFMGYEYLTHIEGNKARIAFHYRGLLISTQQELATAYIRSSLEELGVYVF